MSLYFPLSVRRRFFFSDSEGGKGLCFAVLFAPRSGEGNSGHHSTRFNYSSFHSSANPNLNQTPSDPHVGLRSLVFSSTFSQRFSIGAKYQRNYSTSEVFE